MEFYEPEKNTIKNDSILDIHYHIFAVSAERIAWKYVILHIIAYMFQPIILPIMVILSKILKREIKWFSIKNKG